MWTDIKSAYMRITKQHVSPKKWTEVRVSILLAWIWENFPTNSLEVQYLPREFNKEAIVLFRWGGAGERRMEKLEEEIKYVGKEECRESVYEVGSVLD